MKLIATSSCPVIGVLRRACSIPRREPDEVEAPETRCVDLDLGSTLRLPEDTMGQRVVKAWRGN